jgi:hypothetical protein
MTKKRVQFRFGFSDPEAIASGMKGADCRGAEHEVVILWSLSSGKQVVLVDGLEVHFATARAMDKLQASWTMKGGHQMQVVAHASTPIFNNTPGFRQFDLLIDGLSFWDMPKMYELGTNRGAARAPQSTRSSAYNNYSVPAAQEETQLETRGTRRTSETSDVDRSMSSAQFEAPQTPQSPIPRVNSVPDDLLSTVTPVSEFGDLLEVTRPTFVSPTSVMDEFSPVAAKPSYQNVFFQGQANQILNCYPTQPQSAPPAFLALVNESHTHGGWSPTANVTPTASYITHPPPFSPQASQTYHQSFDACQGEAWGSPATQAPAPTTLTMAHLSFQDLATAKEDSMTPIEKAMSSLVNLENISENVESAEQIKANQKRESNHRSKPRPPATPQWNLGHNASLSDMKSTVPQKQPTNVMRTYAFDSVAVQAGMMGAYGAPSTMMQQQQTGVIPSPNGFGAGVHASHLGAPQQYYGDLHQPIYAGR